MQLLQFRVKQFRSVEDSGWIACDDVTTLVGVNEAGKSNLLLALWKLNPAQSGEINLLADMPRRLFSKARSTPGEMTFIEADFELPPAATLTVAKKALLTNTEGLQVRLSRTYDGQVSAIFLNGVPTASLSSAAFHTVLTQSLTQVQAAPAPDASTTSLKAAAETALEQILRKVPTGDASITAALLQELLALIGPSSQSRPESVVKSAITAVSTELNRLQRYFTRPHLVSGVQDAIKAAMPRFVYYSNYGNLDSEIYLPHAIENMQRTDLTGNAEAKARTLRVLFEYVGLDPAEILQMGQEPANNGYGVTPENIQTFTEQKKVRQALLHSAQSRLTREFRAWWKQGEYSFDFRADGNFFRIYVADRERPDQIELENRSTGLQWFLSFYLVFLVESGEAHANTVLLLDEAGHSLHPLAQRDLAAFFVSLSATNQVIHTTQSPFLVDTNHVDRVKVVYVDDQGFTVTSENLRANEGTDSQQRSVYAVHAALGLSVSDTLLQGCLMVIVEGVSDQLYLNAIKNYLIQSKLIAPSLEVVFVPAGGTRGIKPLSSMFTGREGVLPPIIVDSDSAGKQLQASLVADLYLSAPKRVIALGEIVTVPNAEIEDLIPVSVLDPLLSKLLRDSEEVFLDNHDPAQPLVDQVTAFAKRNAITLDPAWKVTLAKGFKLRLQSKSPPTIDKTVSAAWKKLFTRILS